jgi:predicted RNA binding protein YcfA (HicA-like mRNA interferase family)
MKREDLIRQITREGCYLLRHGSRHDIYINPSTGLKQPVPRHSEIDEHLARHIKKHLGLK